MTFSCIRLYWSKALCIFSFILGLFILLLSVYWFYVITKVLHGKHKSDNMCKRLAEYSHVFEMLDSIPQRRQMLFEYKDYNNICKDWKIIARANYMSLACGVLQVVGGIFWILIEWLPRKKPAVATCMRIIRADVTMDIIKFYGHIAILTLALAALYLYVFTDTYTDLADRLRFWGDRTGNELSPKVPFDTKPEGHSVWHQPETVYQGTRRFLIFFLILDGLLAMTVITLYVLLNLQVPKLVRGFTA